VASRFDKSKPLKRHSGLDLMTSAALLLLFSGVQAVAEEEPAARAPLPPLLRDAPAETVERQMPDRNQSDPGAPATRLDRPRSQLSPKKPGLHSAPYLGTSMAKKRETPARRGNHSINTASRGQGHRTVASEKRQRRDRSPTEPEIGSRQATPLYYPNYFAGPPAYGYAPSYPYAWAPPGLGVFR
jgi:hypothetical protein